MFLWADPAHARCTAWPAEHGLHFNPHCSSQLGTFVQGTTFIYIHNRRSILLQVEGGDRKAEPVPVGLNLVSGSKPTDLGYVPLSPIFESKMGDVMQKLPAEMLGL